MMTPVQYRDRLIELGRLAARLDGDAGHPLEVIFAFYGFDENDQKIIEQAYQEAPTLVCIDRAIEPITIPVSVDLGNLEGIPIEKIEIPPGLRDGIKVIPHE